MGVEVEMCTVCAYDVRNELASAELPKVSRACSYWMLLKLYLLLNCESCSESSLSNLILVTPMGAVSEESLYHLVVSNFLTSPTLGFQEIYTLFYKKYLALPYLTKW